MLRVLLCIMLLASWPGQAVRGAVPGSPNGPAPPQNQAPQTVDYIDVETIYVGGSSTTVTASSYFSDPDGDTLTYSVNNPSPSVATVSISGSTVTITPVAVGTTGKIIVTARDPGGLTATQDFNVTVQNAPPPNRVPTAVGSISNVTLQVGGSSATRSVSGKFSDPDGDALTYSVNDPDTSIVTVSISGSTVTITPVAVGTTGKIIVTARDPGGLTATQDFTATVENPPPVNRVPTAVGSISNVTLQVGGSSATRSVSGKFSDPDGDALTYSVNDPDTSIVTVSISGSTVTIAPVAVGTTGKIIVTARDPGGLTATQDFTATVETPPPVNNSPTAVGSISDVSLSKGGSSATRSVARKFSDPDGDTLTYSVNNPNPSIATVSISGSTVTISPVAIGSTGKIIVTARDPGGLTATQDFTATVVNDPPQPEGSISDVTLYKKGKTRSVSVSSKFSDPNGDALTYSATSNKTNVATVSVSGSTVTVRSGVIGTATITVTAEDTEEATATQTFTVSVTNRYPQPQGTIAKMTFHRGQAARSTDVSDNFRDPDNDALTYTATSSNTSVATVSVSGSDVEVDPGGLGSARVTVYATDTDDARNRHGFDVEVVNRPPIVSRAISDRTLNKNSSTTINASGHFSDPDNDSISFTAESSDTDIADVSVSGSTVTIESEDDGGDATVTVTATDALDDSVSDEFTVTVRNRAPQQRGSVSPVSLYKNRHSQDVVVSGKFTDPDGDTLTYSATSDNSAVAAASVSGGTVTITSGNSGSATITVKAEDIDEASAEQTISVTVTNRPPEIVDSFAEVNLKVGGPSKRFDVSGHFSDPDSDTLKFSVNNPDTLVARVSISGSTVTVAPVSEGNIDKVIVTATDTEKASISEDFRVVVGPEDTTPPPCPAVNVADLLSDQNMKIGDSTVTIDVSDHFINIVDGDAFSISLQDSTQTAVTLSLTGTDLSITPNQVGSSGNIIVKVIRGDEAACSASDKFIVTVAPADETTDPPPCPAVNVADLLSGQNMKIGDSTVTIDVSDHFINIVDGDAFSISLQDSTQTAVTLSLTGTDLSITPNQVGSSGNIIVKVIRGDEAACSASDKFIVTVAPADETTDPTPSCPTANTEDIEVPFVCVGGDPVTMVVSSYFTIPQGVTPTYSTNNPDTTKANVSISGDTLTIDPKAHGDTGKVIITASADGCTDVTRDFNVNVAAAPSASECPAVKQTQLSRDVPLTVGGSDFDVNLNAHFTNLDKSNIEYTIMSSNSDVATASRTDTTLTISPGIAGTAQITIRVSRCGCGTAVSQIFNVRVETTVPGPVTSVTVSPTSVSIQEDETQQFTATAKDSSDTEITGKTFTWTSSATSVATIDSLGLATAVIAGMTTITATTDGVSGTASLTVTEPPTCPMLKGSIADQTLTLGGSAALIDLTQYFSLPVDFDPIYVVSSTDTNVTTTSLAEAMLTVSPAAAGTDTVSVTVSKQDCDSVKQFFVVTVSLPCPAAIADAPIPNQTLSVGADVTRIDLTQHFEHIDQDDIEIAVTSPNPELAVLSIEDSTLKIDPKSAGRIDTVTVTVTDTAESDACDAVSLSFMVTVEESGAHAYPYPWMISGENVYRLTGNVGIGVEDPDQKLVVDGKIKAEEYRLTMVPADYVFEEDYDLMSLEDVERYIHDHGHLPGVVSGTEMKANGIGVSRMQTMLLEKIEELSLHVLEQHETLRAQGDSIDAQQWRIKLQNQRIRQLERRLERLEQ